MLPQWQQQQQQGLEVRVQGPVLLFGAQQTSQTDVAPCRPGRKQQPSKSGLSTTSSSIPEQQCCSTSGEQQQLCSDPAILLYAKQLDDHRKRCELSGR